MTEHQGPLDTMFLDLEQADDGAKMHVGAVMVFDPVPEGVRRTSTGRRWALVTKTRHRQVDGMGSVDRLSRSARRARRLRAGRRPRVLR